MNLLYENAEKTTELVLRQLNNYWIDIDDTVIRNAVPPALELIRTSFTGLALKRYYDYNVDKSILSPYVSTQWMIFLYRLSHLIYENNKVKIPKEADLIYYLNKIMHSNDWFYAIDLPVHFLCEHPLGSVLGRAEYGDYLFVYQGTTIGGNRSNGVLSYPKIGNNVILYANSSVLGDTRIGNNVVISAGTQIINGDVPDNCIVFGNSPNLVIKRKDEAEMKAYTEHIWGWKDR